MRVKAYRLVKDGHTWDYSTHVADIAAWWDKILREEPEAELSVWGATVAEMEAWKSDYVAFESTSVYD